MSAKRPTAAVDLVMRISARPASTSEKYNTANPARLAQHRKERRGDNTLTLGHFLLEWSERNSTRDLYNNTENNRTTGSIFHCHQSYNLQQQSYVVKVVVAVVSALSTGFPEKKQKPFISPCCFLGSG